MWTNVANIPSFVPIAASVPAGSRNRQTSVPAGSRNRPTSVPTGRIIPAGLKNTTARPMTRPTSHYFQHFRRSGYYNQLNMDEGRWGTAVKPSAEFQRRHNLYYFNMTDFQPERDVTCLLAKASLEESTKWHRRMAHVNFKNMNKLAKHGLLLQWIFLVALLHQKSIDHKSKGIRRDYSNARTPQQNGVAERKNRTLIEAARTMLADSMLPTMFWTEAVSTACYVLNRVLLTKPHNKTPYELVSGKVPNISHLKPFGCLVTILNTSDHLGNFEGKANEGFIVGYATHSKAYRVYNLSSKKIEETLNLRYLEDKPNVQGLGHEWYFDLDYLTDSLGYTRFRTNQPAGTQDTNIHAGTQADSDSECDEQVIVVPSFPSNSFSGTKVNEVSDMVEGTDLATNRNRVPAGKVVFADGVTAGPTDPSTHVCTPVHTVVTSLPPGHFLGSSEHSSRYPSPSDLANSMSSYSEIEDIHHHPDSDIFTSSLYDDDFGGTVTNLAPSIVVDSVPTKRVNTIHPQSQILRDLTSPVQTRGTLKKSKFGASAFVSYVHDQQRNNHTDYLHCLFACFLSQLEPSSVAQALNDPAWIEAMQEEMQQFVNQDVWKLVPLPDGNIAIGTKWILKNKRDARGIVVRNKARLVAQGHRQEEGIDYDEVFALVARIEAIRLFLAFASYMGFMVYQMDVKSAFLYGEIEEEVYVTQPKVFEDPHSPKHVYKVMKALYGLHQAPRAGYAILSTFLLKHNYRRGTIDKTLFIKKNSRDIILVQVYVDDIIFGSTNKAWCTEFEVLMKGEFEMSAMGELTFFLGLQVKQKPDGIFISQDKYVQDMLKKFDMESVRPATTPFEASKPKSKDEPDDAVNVHLYRSMIGSLMYLTASRPDIQFAVSACSRHQVTPLTSNLNAVKKIFKYLKGQPKLGLWYPRDSPFVLEAYSDSDYAGSHGDRKSTTGGCQFLGRRLISWQCKKQTIVATSSTEAEYVAAASCCGQEFLLVALNVPTGRTVAAGFVGFLEKPKGSADYHQVLDFLRSSHIRGVEDLPSADIYLGMDNMGYPTEGKLTFHKNKFSPQWRFIVHTIMHCLSTKSGSWDQFGSSLATALICLTEGRKFNWSSYIFKGMVNNITNPKKFLMFPRFLQMILNIETRNSKQYHAFKLTSKMFANMRLNFHGDTMPLLATMLPPAQPAIAGDSSGEAEPTIPHTVPEILTEPAHSHDQASSPPGPTTIPASAQENEQGPFSDPNPASSSRPHASEPKQFTSTNVEDDVFGGSFDISPPRSTEAPPAGTTSGGAEDPNKLTALCSLVNSLVQKIDSQASDLKAHKLVFKEVVGKLLKKVKELEDKLKGRKRKFVMTEFDLEEEEEQDIDPFIKLAKAAATAADELAVPTGGSNEDDIPPSLSIPSDGSAIPPDREEERLGAEAARRLYEEEQAELAREREEQKQKRQKDVLESAKYYTDADWNEIMGQVHANQGLSADLLGPNVNEENFAARMVALIAERRRKFVAQRFQDKRNKPMTYAQQRDYMRTFVKNQSSTIYSTGWTLKHVRTFSDDQLKDEFDKIRHALDNLQSQHLRRSLKRQGADLEQPDSKKSKSTEPQKTSVPAASRPSSAGVTPDVHQSPFVDTPPATPPHSPKASSHPDVTPDTSKQPSVAPTPPSGFSATPTVTRTSGPRTRNQSSAAGIKTYSTRRKSLGSRKMSSSEVDLIAADSQEDVEVPSTTTSTAQQTAFKTKKVGTRRKQFGQKGVHPSRSTIPIEDGDPDADHKMCIKYVSESDDDTPVNLHGVIDLELLPTGLGWVNVIYRKDNSRKCFSRLREILHLVTRTDLMIIYGRVMQFYQDTEATGVGLVLWGDLKVLIDSPEVNDGSDTMSGIVLHMFVDKRYPLSVNLIERMLKHQLEICRDTVGNELTTAVQLIIFLKKQISNSRRPKVHDCCGDPVAVHLSMLSFLLLLQSSDVFPAGSVVPTGKDNSIVSTGSTIVFLLVEQYYSCNPSSLLPPFHNSLSGSTTSSSPSLRISETSNYFLKEFVDELAHITFPPGNDDLPFDAKSDLLELEYLLNHDPIKDMDSILEDSTVNDDTYDDPFEFKEEKIKDSKILIDELDLPESNNVLTFLECDSVFYEDFSEVEALSSTNNEDKVFNPGILIHENLFEVTNFATPDKNVKKATNASLILEDFNPPLYELPFHKEVPGLGVVLSFSSKNEEKVYNPGILTSKRVHTSLLLELSHRGTKAFKVTKILESPMEIFPCSYQEDIRSLDVPCFHFYPP
ncbi:putative ribonuclease H-like domain-containing protein [Tanacetum coccineum]